MKTKPSRSPRKRFSGRGTPAQPPGRFLKLQYQSDEPTGQRRVATEFFRDSSRTVLSRNRSPDVAFEYSLNPYRGCEHGCAYCYARPTHEYFDLSAGIDFETKIMVKEDAPLLLRQQLLAKSWKPQPIALSGVTDPYQPVERRWRLTRACLEVLRKFRNPVLIVTKNWLVTRDVDLLASLAEKEAALVCLSIATLDAGLQRSLEPRASSPQRRLAAVKELVSQGIPVRVLVAPVIPGLTDHEVPAILQSAAEAGATGAGYVLLRLPYGVKDLFIDWLERCVPTRKERVLSRIREVRSGRLSDSGFSSRMRGQGTYAVQLENLFRLVCRRSGLNQASVELSVEHFRRPGQDRQLGLFQQ